MILAPAAAKCTTKKFMSTRGACRPVWRLCPEPDCLDPAALRGGVLVWWTPRRVALSWP